MNQYELYRNGDGVPAAEAIKWYRRAANQGHSIAGSWLHRMEGRRQTERPRPFR